MLLFFITWQGDHAQALPLLTALVHTDKYSQAGVWLKLAECRHVLGDLEASASAYCKVISLAPNHTESRWVSVFFLKASLYQLAISKYLVRLCTEF